MELVLQREPSTPKSTPGQLYIGTGFECYVIEDVVRETSRQEGQSREAWVASWKIKGQTAIPAGRYRVVLTRSERFSRSATARAGHPVEVITPLLLEVPGFSGIRIHAGNTSEDTEGCLLPGCARPHLDAVTGSRLAYDNLVEKIRAALAAELVYINVLNAAPSDQNL